MFGIGYEEEFQTKEKKKKKIAVQIGIRLCIYFSEES
jgi:hypothetical protein